MIDELRVDTKLLGTQRVAIPADLQTPITLAPVGQVAGRLVPPADFAGSIQGIMVRVRSIVAGFEGSGISGEAEVPCDSSGRFEMAALAAGALRIDLGFDREQT